MPHYDCTSSFSANMFYFEPLCFFCFFFPRLTGWIPDVPKDVNWLYGLVEDIYKQAWKDEVEDDDGYVKVMTCSVTGTVFWLQWFRHAAMLLDMVV